MINLGEKVKDMITDFEGTAIARCVYLNGCVRCGVQAKGLKDGQPIECVWIDEGQLISKTDEEAKIQRGEEVIGGPGDVPSEFSHP